MKAILLVFVAFLFMGLFAIILYHEYTHQRVFISTGYVNVTTYSFVSYENYELKLMVFTNGDPTNYTDYKAQRDFNIMTEIVGFDRMAFTINLWLIALFLVFSYWFIRGRADRGGA